MAVLLLALSVPSIATAAGLLPVYRFYNMRAGGHFFTASTVERDIVLSQYSSTYRPEGIAFTVNTDDPLNNAPLYRFYNTVAGGHFFTTSTVERDIVLTQYASTYRAEGIAFNVSVNPSGAPVYRFYNMRAGGHFFTASDLERSVVLSQYSSTYRPEGVGFYLAGGGTPPPGGDVTDPITTSDTHPSYQLSALIHLTATDNPGGSGVATTNYILDGVPGTGTTVLAVGVGTHVLEFWSVDVAGNVETHQLVSFTVTPLDMPWHLSTTEFCTQSGCHFASLTVEHYRWPIGDVPKLNCSSCHSSTDPLVMATIAAGSDDCFACHQGMGVPGAPVGHAGTTVSHALPDLDCTVAGCHSGTGVDLASIHVTCERCHADGQTPKSGCTSAAPECHGAAFDHGPHTTITSTGDPTCTTAACHPASPTDAGALHATCAVCHGSTDANVRAVIAAGLTGSDAACEDCHDTGYTTIHKTTTAPHLVDKSLCLSSCHPNVLNGPFNPVTDTNVTVIHAATLNGCRTCHTVPPTTLTTECFTSGCHPHAALIGTSHTVSGAACYNPCHQTDVSIIHTTGDDPPGCVVCHDGNPAHLTLVCDTCHTNIGTVHNFVHVDASGTLSTACTTCHGTDLPTAHNGVFTGQPNLGCFCHIGVPSWLRAEMAPLLAAGTAECVDCHKGPYAAHSFGMNASGHNTDTYDKTNNTFSFPLTRFDGSQGVVLRDTEENTPDDVVVERPPPAPSVTRSVGAS